MTKETTMEQNNQPINLEPAQELLIQNLDTLKVLSDALRSRLVDLLRREPQTVKQLAAVLETVPKKLYYHINLLEQHGLIRVIQTRLVSGIVEKTYRATAYLFLFEDEVFAANTTDESGLPLGTALLFESTKNQLAQSVADQIVDLHEAVLSQRRLLSTWNMRQLTAAQAEVFYTKLAALIQEFEELPFVPAAEEAQAYRLFLTLFPIRRHLQPPISSDGAGGKNAANER
ncbi:MAG: helix-turn-helix transcriptional regulator [Caldilineaceae bacterium]|nr:helix-turn-helix transcriptional regulator [Caldilineaceae bacterium]